MPTQTSLVKLGHPLIQLSEVDSTNNYAHKLLKNNSVQNGTAIFALLQTSGKGQMSKSWESEQGKNIMVSVIVDISTVHLQNQFALVAMASLACYSFFRQFAGEGTAIKWSNDIYFNDNKAGGILIETVTKQQKRFAIIGIGININQTIFTNSLLNATSLALITHKTYDLNTIINRLFHHLSYYYNLLIQNKTNELFGLYNEALYKKGKQITLKKDNIKFSCTINGVNNFGELIVSNSIYTSFKFGEVQFVFS